MRNWIVYHKELLWFITILTTFGSKGFLPLEDGGNTLSCFPTDMKMTTEEHFTSTRHQYNPCCTVNVDAKGAPTKLKTVAVKCFCVDLLQQTQTKWDPALNLPGKASMPYYFWERSTSCTFFFFSTNEWNSLWQVCRCVTLCMQY